MKALILDAPREVRFGDVPAPEPIGDDVLIRVGAVGISRQDMAAYQGIDTPDAFPMMMGHEVAGTVIGGAYNGTRVVVNPNLTCGSCEACVVGRTNLCADRTSMFSLAQSGGMSEYLTVDPRNILQLPNTISFEKACLIDPLTRGWSIARMARRAFPQGRAAMVVGGGAIGLGAQLALQAQGVDDVSTFDRDGGEGKFFDIIIDVESTPETREYAADRVAAGGVIGHWGTAQGDGGYDVNRLSQQEATLVCMSTYTALDFSNTAAAAFDGRLGELDWAECYALSEAVDVFANLAAGRITAPRVVLQP